VPVVVGGGVAFREIKQEHAEEMRAYELWHWETDAGSPVDAVLTVVV